MYNPATGSGLLGWKQGSLLNKTKPTSEQVLADLKGFIPDNTLQQLENKYKRNVQDHSHAGGSKRDLGLANNDLCGSVGRKSLQRLKSVVPPRDHRKNDSVESELCFLSDSDTGGESSDEEIDQYFHHGTFKPNFKIKSRSGLVLGRYSPHPPLYPIPDNTLSNAAKIRRHGIKEYMPFSRKNMLPDVKTRAHQPPRSGNNTPNFNFTRSP